MAVSPLLVPPGSGSAKSPARARSMLSGTPSAHNGAAQEGASSYEPVPDLAEQMNLEEKSKWIKGTAASPTPIPSLH